MSTWPERDDVPVVLVTLDGLGDRPCRALGGRTPAEAAHTPVLDEFTRRGASGVHVPFGPGWATSSERSHWAMFGLSEVEFPGRAALELLGVGGQPAHRVPMWHLAVRRGESTPDGGVRITGRLGREEVEVSAIAHSILQSHCSTYVDRDIRFQIVPLRAGEWVLIAEGAHSHEISDTDPLFEHLHPWMRPLVLREAERAGGVRAVQAARTAAAMEEFLLGAHEALRHSGIDYDIPTTKWASFLDQPVSFREEVGVAGAMVTSSALYRGFARFLTMSEFDVAAPAQDVSLGLAARVETAVDVLDSASPFDFVHVHTKAPDEAGHTKNPDAKVAAIEACDAALAPLLDRDDCVIAVTGDHATPSETLLLHSGDPTPFVVTGPDVRVDGVETFGETSMLAGSLGRLSAVDISPLLHGLARRPFFIGHRPGVVRTSAMPLAVPAMAPHRRTSNFVPVPPPTLKESHA